MKITIIIKSYKSRFRHHSDKIISLSQSPSFGGIGEALRTCLTARRYMALLITNQVYVSKKHNSADAVAICMLLLQQNMFRQRCRSWVQLPFPCNNGIAQLVERRPFYAGSIPAPTQKRIAKWLGKAQRMLDEKKYTASQMVITK